MPRITSADVAREAGLSRATVSYVLNDDPRQRIPDETRRRVLEAASRLGYTPYGPARLLRGARGRTVLLVTPTLATAAEPVGSAIVSALAEALHGHGLELLWQLGAPHAAMASDLAPVMVLTSLGEDEVGFAQLTARTTAPVRSVFPGLDEFQAAPGAAQVDHLADRGHLQLAYAASADPHLDRPSGLRREAVLGRAAERDLPPPRVFAMPLDRPAARAALHTLLTDDPRPTAVCAYNDRVAMATLAAAYDLGMAVPQDLAVIGVDDDPLAELTSPALSSVTADLGDFVSRLAADVAAGIAGEESRGVRLPTWPVVVPRDSS
ncbi:MAG TPA: LacI family DNA-binding transcriptional regulator [Naasia sp.]|jgi:DNA-binding LacI/PurR family transcriptional regulator